MPSTSTAELLDRSIYSYSDVDRLIGLTPGTGKRWLEGHDRSGVFYEPVLRAEPTGKNAVTWGEMVEARLLAEFRGRAPMQRLRPAIVRLREEFGRYPLARAKPFLDVAGRELVVRVQEEVALDQGLQMVVVRNGQAMLGIRTERFQDAATYKEGYVAEIIPERRTPAVRMSPANTFGQPCIRGVRTEILAEDFRAGVSPHALADLYDLTPDQVEQGLRFEMSVTAARAS